MSAGDVTRLLSEWRAGDAGAAERLFPHMYEELRRIARGVMRGERADHTLAPTALVHEAYVRLVDADVAWQDRVHFYAVAARAMRRLLVDHARARQADKRGAGGLRVTLDDDAAVASGRGLEILDLERALEQLAELAPRKAQAVELHFFGGMKHQEIAEALDVSISTVRGDLRFSRAWLERALNPDGGD